MKTIKSVLFSVFLFTILFSCALKPTEIEKEKKDYQGTIHNVENANYEFEERLNSFYESEHIESKDLDTLYKGEYPDGVEEPTMLRIHWQKARELAIAELELQKAIQTNWQEAKISLRPVLALDRDGGDYYRYYEYRVLKDDNAELGAIRIPVYRRTENFTTSEVHLYSGDGKTYKIEPTMWGIHFANNMQEDKTTDFFKKIKERTDTVVTDNFAYNFLYFTYNYSGLGLNSRKIDIPAKHTYDKLYALYSKYMGQMSGTKKQVSDASKKSVIDASARKEALNYKETIDKVANLLYKLETIAVLAEPTKESIVLAFENTTSLDFFAGLSLISVKIGVDQANSLISRTIKDIYWDNAEAKDEKSVREYLIAKKWNIYKELDDREIKPVIEYPEYYKYPQREKKTNPEYAFQEYQLVDSIEEHTKLIESVPGFISKDGFKSSLFTHMKDANGHEFSKEAAEKMNKGNIDSRKNMSLNTYSINKNLVFPEIYNIENKLPLADFMEIAKLSILGSVRQNRGAFLSNWWKEEDIFDNRKYKGDGVANFLEIGIVLPLAILDIPGYIAYEVKGKQFALVEVLDRILDEISSKYAEEGGLEEFYYLLEDLKKERPFRDKKGLSQALTVGQAAAKSHIDGAPKSVKDVFVSAYDWWLVWYVPFLPIPTGIWITKIAGNVKPDSYTYRMGIPFGFNLDNVIPPERQKIKGVDKVEPEIQLNPELESVPEKLRPNASSQWLQVNNWLNYSKLYDYDINTNHQTFKHLTQDDVTNVYSSFVDTVYDLYEGNTLVHIDKSKPYAEATNIITNIVTNKPPMIANVTNIITNVIYNVIDNPTMNQKDEQNKYNINKLKDIINTNYNITLKAY